MSPAIIIAAQGDARKMAWLQSGEIGQDAGGCIRFAIEPVTSIFTTSAIMPNGRWAGQNGGSGAARVIHVSASCLSHEVPRGGIGG
jgi:hypothetical protein